MSRVCTVDKPVKVHAFAEYPLFSELTATDWWATIETEIVADTAVVEDAEMVHSTINEFGLQYVYFRASFYVRPGPTKEVKRQARKVLNRLVCDSDVKVLNIMRVGR
jgi:hypothetical protein